MGLPEIIMEFKTKGLTAIKRSGRGIVACILKDNTEGGESLNVYNGVEDVDYTHWSAKNYGYLNLIYSGAPSRVIVIRLPEDSESYNDALKTLRNMKWNYLTIPSIAASELTVVSAWIKEQRKQHRKTFKAVLPNCPADHEGIINFTTDKVQVTDGETVTDYSRAEFCARIAGLLAGLSLARSSTYYVLSDVVGADVPDDPDERINAGELILVFDGEDYKIGRGVNSFVSFTTEQGEDLSSIKIIEGKDLYQDDINDTFEKHYVGKVRNDYDNKQAFVAAINNYHREIEGDVLDSSHDNVAMISIDGQRSFLEGKGIDTSGMSDTELAQANTAKKVFVDSDIKFVEAMEDLTMRCYM